MTLSRMAKEEYLLLCLLIALVDFSCSLYLSQSSVSTGPGKSLAISCRDISGQPVTWKGPKGTLSSNTRPTLQDSSIGKLLVFTPTRVQDTGNYTCSLANNKNEFRIFALSVEDVTDTTLETETSTIDHLYTHHHVGHNRESTSEEPLQFKDTPEIQRAREGDNYTLRCEINRPYKINWLLDADENNFGTRYLTIGDGLLIINVSRHEDNRIFICEVLQNSTGLISQKKIKFIVEHEPVPVINSQDPETGEPSEWAEDEVVYGFIGENVNLTCEVSAEPPAIFDWKRENRMQRKNGRILNGGTNKSIFQLKMTDQTEDTYQCTANNKHGKLKKKFELHIGIRPVVPEKIELVQQESDNLKLKVEVPVNNESSLITGMEPQWLNIFYRNINSEDWDEQIFNISSDTFTLTGLNSSTKYEIMAATKNIASLSELTNSTYFETKSSSIVQINNLILFFSLAIINILIL